MFVNIECAFRFWWSKNNQVKFYKKVANIISITSLALVAIFTIIFDWILEVI